MNHESITANKALHSDAVNRARERKRSDKHSCHTI